MDKSYRHSLIGRNLSQPRRHRAAVAAVRREAEVAVPRVRHRAVIVDLNNFATFPTLAVGLLVAGLRSAGFEAEVLSPLAHDVPAAERERPECWIDDWTRRMRLSSHPLVAKPREWSRRGRSWWQGRPHRRVLQELERILDTRPDVLMLSAYLQHYHTVVQLGRLAASRGVPLLLGGPVFNHPSTAAAWRSVPGLAAIFGGEADLVVADLVSEVIGRGDLLRFEGVMLPDGRSSPPAAPLRDLDRLPVPDFSDFPWDRYRMRLLPIMTGRGCQWKRCTFCSDVVSANGRTFRTRSIDAILHEVRELSRRHDSVNFLFLDLKLNSSPAILRGIVENIQRNAPGAQWVGTVHVDGRSDNGLSRGELRAAAAAGMRRVSFGLETGSQRLLDAMRKGCTVEANEQFIANASEAGLSVRCTMFKGYPGEGPADLEATAAFLERNADRIDRIRFNELAVLEGTPLHRMASEEPQRLPQLRVLRTDCRDGMLRHENVDTRGPAYRAALRRVLAAVHAINRRPVRRIARAFDGVM